MGKTRSSAFDSRISLAIPAAAFGIVFLIFSAIAGQMYTREKSSLHQLMAENAALIASNFKETLDAQILAFSRMAHRWQVSSDMKEEAWREDALNYVHDLPGLKIITLEAPERHIRWTENNQNGGSFSSDINLSQLPESKGLTVISMSESKDRLLVWKPLTDKSLSAGYIVGGFDTEQLLHRSLSPLIKKYYDVTFGNVDVVHPNAAVSSFLVEQPLDINGISLRLKALPTQTLLAARTSPLPKALLACGFFLALLAALAAYYAKRSIVQATKLQEQDASFQVLIDGVVDYAIYMLDIEGNIKSWNTGAQRIKQYTPQEVLGKSFSIFFTSEDAADGQPAKSLIIAAETGRFEAEGWRVRKDGSRFWASIVVDAIKDIKGNPLGFAKVTRDITKMKEQAELLKASEETFRLAMEHAAIGKALVSPEGKFLKVNMALCKILGYETFELLNLDFQAITHPDDLEADIAYVGQLLSRERDSYQMEKRYYHKQGHTIWVLLTVSLIWNADGTPRYFVSELQNLTSQKKNENEREALIQKLVDSNSELERFAFVASHDLQEPIRLVCNFTDLLRQGDLPGMGAEAKQYIDIIAASAQRMHLLITDLLDYARIGNSEERNELFESRECMQYVVENLQGVINHSLAQIIYDEMPQLYGSPVRFSTLMQNLMGNALKYRRADAPPEIHIGAHDNGGDRVFYVKDNGIGIKPEYCDQIFEPFKRLHNQNEYPGTGMGLAICRKIVDQAGGRMWVESALGKGSTFYFSLPDRPSATSSEDAA